MLFALLAAALAVVTTVLFITIGDSAPPFNMPQGAHNDQYGDKHKGNERARDRARRKKASMDFDRQQRENGHSRVSGMQPLPVCEEHDCDHDRDDEEEELDEEMEMSVDRSHHRVPHVDTPRTISSPTNPLQR